MVAISVCMCSISPPRVPNRSSTPSMMVPDVISNIDQRRLKILCQILALIHTQPTNPAYLKPSSARGNSHPKTNDQSENDQGKSGGKNVIAAEFEPKQKPRSFCQSDYSVKPVNVAQNRASRTHTIRRER